MVLISLYGKTPYGYRSVPQLSEESDDREKSFGRSLLDPAAYAQNIRKLIIGLAAGTTLALVMVYLAATTVRDLGRSNAQSFVRHCGSSPDEARQLGCKFEVHNFAWVPPECYNEELSVEWDEDTTWSFSKSRWEDVSQDPPDLYTLEHAYSGDLAEAWVPWRQHIAHCAFVVRKYGRAVENGWPMDNWTSSMHHMDHCVGNFMRQDIPLWSYTSILHMIFPVCDYSWRKDTRPLGERTWS